MIVSALILFAVTLAVAAYAKARQPEAIPEAAEFTTVQLSRLAVRLPFALIAAQCLAELIPDNAVAQLIGPGSGFGGVLIASFAGAVVPGGPMVSFPIALVLAGEGAGLAQLTALISGWSVFAFHRVIAYESPVLGWRFVALRLLSSVFVPPSTGLLMMLVLYIAGQGAIAIHKL